MRGWLDAKINVRLNVRLNIKMNQAELVWSEYEAVCVADCEAEWEAE